jgi:tripartite-type tricarboxylate transporter receptor subunit TctC
VIAEGWYALYAPAGTPARIIETLQRAVAATLALPTTQQVIAGLGGIVQSSSPEGLADYQRTEFTKWGEVVRASGASMN